MKLTVHPSKISGKVRAVSSKSAAHRLLFCASFADADCEIYCPDISDDIKATASCLVSLGADIKYENSVFYVKPIKELTLSPSLDCGESGTTYRFLLPLIAALGNGGELVGHGRLPSRPLSPLYEVLEGDGIRLSPQGSNPLKISGRLSSQNYSFDGNVSSQFASGMLLAFAARESVESDGVSRSLTLTGKIESSPYIALTLDILKKFGVNITVEEELDVFRKYSFEPCMKLLSPKRAAVEGDFSSAAFWLAASAVTNESSVTLTGLDISSRQADREIITLLKRFGARITENANEITVKSSDLCGIEIDASQIPDLVPILSVVASAAIGETLIYNASRLRLKESDRLQSVRNMIVSLGGKVEEGDDYLKIHGKGKLSGGTVDCANDHRIAMSAAVASLICENSVTLLGAECVTKSYPDFYRDAKALGMNMEECV